MDRFYGGGRLKVFGLRLKNILFILIGSAVFSFGLVHFNIQNQLGEGGFTGITLLLLYLFNWDPAVMNIVLNIPVLIIGWKSLGRVTFYYSLIGIVAVSVFIKISQLYMIDIPLSSDMTLAALFAGVFIGIGLGIIFRYGGTTGGVDIIARLINKYFGWSMGRAMFAFDAVVILVSILTYLDHIRGMYTLLAVFIGARVIDFIQEGAYAARGTTIISEKSEEISKRVMEEMDRGVTVLEGRGSFSGAKRDVLYCVIAKNEIVRLKSIIDHIDPHAFVAVNHVHDVMGEGFTLDENKNPIE
ncbi:YitT family protein [Bacillus sp. SB49]|uniref:YitT family protein n=1 Tax=Bacillaceae TaxID=186817 RepID=UPI000552270A|nr:YitT family protein [Bacillus sp. SB49]